MSNGGGLSADDLQWRDEFTLAQHEQLKVTRGIAEKWAGGIAALIGAFSAVSVVVAPAKLGDLQQPWARITVFIAAVAAGAFGVGALLLANRAAEGRPKTDATATWRDYRRDVINLAADAATSLKWSRICTGIALSAIVVAALLSQLDGITAKQESLYVIVTSPEAAAQCGALSEKDGLAMVGGEAIPSGSLVTIVSHC